GNAVRQSNNGETVSLSSELYANVSLDTTPSLTADEAQAIAVRLTGDAGLATASPELVVLPVEAAGFRLAYCVRIKRPVDRLVYFIDAQTGAVVRQYSDLQRQSAVGHGTGVFGDAEKVSAAALGGAFVAEDLLRPPTIVTFDLHGNVARSLG